MMLLNYPQNYLKLDSVKLQKYKGYKGLCSFSFCTADGAVIAQKLWTERAEADEEETHVYPVFKIRSLFICIFGLFYNILYPRSN